MMMTFSNGNCFSFTGMDSIATDLKDYHTCYLDVDPSHGYDLAILVLMEPVTLSPKISPIKLPFYDQDCSQLGKNLIAGGWGHGIPKEGGYNYYHNRWSRYLWAVKLQCLSLDNCGFPRKSDLRSYLCVGDPNEHRNSECYRDGGGPLTYTQGKDTILFGILHGHGQGTVQTICRDVDAFVRISEPSTLTWIISQINKYQ